MAEEQFKPGSMVRLRSGGPRMTVATVHASGFDAQPHYLCRWFDDKNTHQEATFSDAELEAAPVGPAVRFGSIRTGRG